MPPTPRALLCSHTGPGLRGPGTPSLHVAAPPPSLHHPDAWFIPCKVPGEDGEAGRGRHCPGCQALGALASPCGSSQHPLPVPTPHQRKHTSEGIPQRAPPPPVTFSPSHPSVQSCLLNKRHKSPLPLETETAQTATLSKIQARQEGKRRGKVSRRERAWEEGGQGERRGPPHQTESAPDADLHLSITEVVIFASRIRPSVPLKADLSFHSFLC